MYVEINLRYYTNVIKVQVKAVAFNNSKEY